MFDLNSVIGLDEQEAILILKKNGFNNIKTVLNSTANIQNATRLVCAVRKNIDEIVLVCGEFLLDLKEK